MKLPYVDIAGWVWEKGRVVGRVEGVKAGQYSSREEIYSKASSAVEGSYHEIRRGEGSVIKTGASESLKEDEAYIRVKKVGEGKYKIGNFVFKHDSVIVQNGKYYIPLWQLKQIAKAKGWKVEESENGVDVIFSEEQKPFYYSSGLSSWQKRLLSSDALPRPTTLAEAAELAIQKGTVDLVPIKPEKLGLKKYKPSPISPPNLVVSDSGYVVEGSQNTLKFGSQEFFKTFLPLALFKVPATRMGVLSGIKDFAKQATVAGGALTAVKLAPEALTFMAVRARAMPKTSFEALMEAVKKGTRTIRIDNLQKIEKGSVDVGKGQKQILAETSVKTEVIDLIPKRSSNYRSSVLRHRRINRRRFVSTPEHETFYERFRKIRMKGEQTLKEIFAKSKLKITSSPLALLIDNLRGLHAKNFEHNTAPMYSASNARIVELKEGLKIKTNLKDIFENKLYLSSSAIEKIKTKVNKLTKIRVNNHSTYEPKILSYEQIKLKESLKSKKIGIKKRKGVRRRKIKEDLYRWMRLGLVKIFR